jgi:hypothetical protein
MKTNSPSLNLRNENGHNTKVIIDLLAEYSTKLNDMAKEWDTRRRRSVSLSITWLSAEVFVLFGYFLIEKEIRLGNAMFFSIALIIISSLIFAQLISIEIKQGKHIQESMRLLKARLEKLVSKASQIEEHVEQDEENLLMLDLRLAEAESTLRLIGEIM